MAKDISKKELTFDTLPDEKSPQFAKLVETIIEDYKLTSKTEMAMAKRAAKQFWYMEYCDSMLKKYGLFNVMDGKVISVNPIGYFIRQVESEFRSYIRMLQQKNKTDVQKPDDLMKMLEGVKK